MLLRWFRPHKSQEMRVGVIHSHAFVRMMTIGQYKEHDRPVNVYECACGARRIVPSGATVDQVEDLAPDPRGFPHRVLIDAGRLKENEYG